LNFLHPLAPFSTLCHPVSGGGNRLFLRPLAPFRLLRRVGFCPPGGCYLGFLQPGEISIADIGGNPHRLYGCGVFERVLKDFLAPFSTLLHPLTAPPFSLSAKNSFWFRRGVGCLSCPRNHYPCRTSKPSGLDCLQQTTNKSL
jgi:hypothetical protein